MKKYYFLIIVALILGLVLTGCSLSNVGQVPTTEQSGVNNLTKGSPIPIILSSNEIETKQVGWTTTNPSADPLDPNNYSGSGFWSLAALVTSPPVPPWYSPFEASKWVSTASSLETACGNGDSWRLFKAEFNIPTGAIISSAQLWMTADNTVEAYLNDDTVMVGNTGVPPYVYDAVVPPPGSQPTYYEHLWGPFDFIPSEGTNTLYFVVRNFYYTDYNPVGLLYRAEIEYVIPSIEIVKIASTTVAAPGETVTYTYTVKNTGDCTLYDVSLEDDVVGFITLTGLTDEDGDGFANELAVNVTATGTVEYIILEDAPEHLCNIATARSWYEDILVSADSYEVCVRTMCARSIGYWGNHQEDWCGLPSESIFSLVEPSTLLTYFPGNGIEEDGVNPLEMLRVQLLAAELNVACFDVVYLYDRYERDLGGYDTIYEVIEAVELFLSDYPPESWPTNKKEQREFRKAHANSLALKDVLDTFNNMGDECFPIEEVLNSNE